MDKACFLLTPQKSHKIDTTELASCYYETTMLWKEVLVDILHLGTSITAPGIHLYDKLTNKGYKEILLP